MLYGAIYGKQPPSLPEGMRYTVQIQQPLAWIMTFLHGRKQDLVRVMDVDTHFRRGVAIDIVMDASPWGMGAILSIDGCPAEYFAVPTTDADARHIGLEISRDSKCQQAFEALTVLVALRHWRYHWATRRVVLHVSSDNMSALSMVCKMQPHSESLGVIARELTLDIADSVYEPQLVSHTPGVANIAADMLSRKFEPGHHFSLPHCLAAATETLPAERTTEWWRALVPRRCHSAR